MEDGLEDVEGVGGGEGSEATGKGEKSTRRGKEEGTRLASPPKGHPARFVLYPFQSTHTNPRQRQMPAISTSAYTPPPPVPALAFYILSLSFQQLAIRLPVREVASLLFLSISDLRLGATRALPSMACSHA